MYTNNTNSSSNQYANTSPEAVQNLNKMYYDYGLLSRLTP